MEENMKMEVENEEVVEVTEAKPTKRRSIWSKIASTTREHYDEVGFKGIVKDIVKPVIIVGGGYYVVKKILGKKKTEEEETSYDCDCVVVETTEYTPIESEAE